ncbi:MAG: Ig-like domain-containing protein [Candidatus Aenigmatarchaeota archaeon]
MKVGKSLVLIFVLMLLSGFLIPSVSSAEDVRRKEGGNLLEASVEIISPSEGDIINTPNVEVEWDSQDADGHSVRINNGDWEYLSPDETSYTFEGVENGNHTVDVEAIKEQGDDARDTVNYTVEAPQPSIEITSPDEGEVFDVPEVTVEWNSEEVSYHEVRLNGDYWIDVGDNTSHTFEDLDEGEHDVEVRGFYDEENMDTDNVTFEVDIDMPEIDIYAPEEEEIFGEEEVTVEWEYNNTEFHEVRLDEGDWINIGMDSSYTFDELDDGDHLVEVRGGDDYYQDSDRVYFIVDTAEPDIEIVSPEEGEVLQTGSVEVEWETANELTEIVEQRLRLDGGIWETPTLDGQYEFEDVDDGEHEIEVEATDEAGNTGGASLSFVVDTEDPELEITSPSEDGSLFEVDHVTVRWRGDDEGTGIRNYQVKIEHKDWLDLGRETEHTFSDLINGGYKVWVRAWDGVNNSQTREISFKVETISEDVSVEIIDPKEGDRIPGPNLTVEWTSEKAVYHEVRVDGGRWRKVDNYTTYTFNNLSVGEHTIEVRAVDEAGWRRTDEITLEIVEEGQIMSISVFGVPYLIWILLIIVAANVALVTYLSFKE